MKTSMMPLGWLSPDSIAEPKSHPWMPFIEIFPIAFPFAFT
jgi:hypothetical protein